MRQQLRPGDPLPAIIKEINQERIDSWARISGDYNRLHVDPDYARKTGFKGTIAHGPLSLAFLNELMMQVFGRSWATGGKLTAIRFIAPAYPGDRLLVGGSVVAVKTRSKEATIKCSLHIKKTSGEKTVTGEAECRLPGEY